MLGDENEQVTIQKIADPRSNRMKLYNYFNHIKNLEFFTKTGHSVCKGKVIASNYRTLIVEFSGGYKETFFYESLLEMECQSRINCTK